MNSLNEQRAQIVAEQLTNLGPNDVTPMTNFEVSPEYALIAHLPVAINDSIYAIASEMKGRFPEHYYYSPGQYHLTVVPVPHTIDLEKAVETITPIVEGWHLPISAYGVVANRFQAGAVLYPEEETLVSHRNKLRSALGIAGQAYTVHNSVWEELLWVNFMRFTSKPEAELLAFLREHVKTEIGRFVLGKYELYEVSTKTLDPASSTLLHTFNA